jgi:uncharacterized protein involved in exopolysaccharide biosynthesis
VVRTSAVLVFTLMTLFGCLGGLLVTFVQPTVYHAEAYVIVYEMPSGFTELISPDEANNLNAIYRAGALQESVLRQVQARLPNLSASDIRSSVDVAVVAYTPLTRITASARTAELAVALANAVADGWTRTAGDTIYTAWTATDAALATHEAQLLQQIEATQKAIATTPASSSSAAALQQHLTSLEHAFSTTDAALVSLDKYRFDVAGNAYVTLRASPASATMDPNPLKTAAIGAAVGGAIGIVLAMWVTRRAFTREASLRLAQVTEASARKYEARGAR